MVWKLILSALTAFALGACVPPQMYEWGEYEGRLYSYYEDPEKIEELMKALDTTIVVGEESKRVPPGIYAEYGYLLFVRSRDDEAIVYFKKEKDTWPESVVLMDKMIAVVEAKKQRTEPSGDTGSGEKKE